MPRGRPIGSTGTVCIPLRELNEKFNQDTLIPIKSSFARAVFPDKIVIVKPEEKQIDKPKENDKIVFSVRE